MAKQIDFWQDVKASIDQRKATSLSPTIKQLTESHDRLVRQHRKTVIEADVLYVVAELVWLTRSLVETEERGERLRNGDFALTLNSNDETHNLQAALDKSKDTKDAAEKLKALLQPYVDEGTIPPFTVSVTTRRHYYRTYVVRLVTS